MVMSLVQDQSARLTTSRTGSDPDLSRAQVAVWLPVEGMQVHVLSLDVIQIAAGIDAEVCCRRQPDVLPAATPHILKD